MCFVKACCLGDALLGASFAAFKIFTSFLLYQDFSFIMCLFCKLDLKPRRLKKLEICSLVFSEGGKTLGRINMCLALG